MVQSLQLGTPDLGRNSMRRVNRLPVAVVLVLGALFLAVILYGLSSRGFYFRGEEDIGSASGSSASNYADQIKRGIADGIIPEPAQPHAFTPTPIAEERPVDNPRKPDNAKEPVLVRRGVGVEPEGEWLARIEREQKEQYLRERNRQDMARLQARSAAFESPLAVAMKTVEAPVHEADDPERGERSPETRELYAAAMQASLATTNANGQTSKQEFFNQDIKELGYLPNRIIAPLSAFELKRGSVIPATLISGINSDLPGRIIAQVNQNVFDSASGRRLLIPQGAKLFGRYDSGVSFGQSRVLVIWTDLIFPNGSTLQIGGMAGTDAEGYGGFGDKINRHYLQTFGSAALLAVIGTGMDMSLPQGSTLAGQDNASDAARRNFAEVYGRVVERNVSKALDVQPTLQIRPGYQFNVLVDQDIAFPGVYRH